MTKLYEELKQKNDVLNDIEIEIIKVDLAMIKQYIENNITIVNNKHKSSQSLNDYLSSLPDNKGKLVIADLSEVNFNGDKNKDEKIFNQTKDSLIDLKGADFSGSLLKNTIFDEVDLTGAVFRDTDLSGVSYKDSKLANVDFRGADLSTTKFDKGYMDLPADSKASYIDGIKFSSTSYLMRDYAGIKPDFTPAEAYKYRTRNDNIIAISEIPKDTINLAGKAANKAIETVEKSINPFSKALKWVAGGTEQNSENIITKVESISLEEDKIVNPSLRYIFGSNSKNFDQMYIRGSSNEERKRKKEFIRLEDSEIREYLTLIKTEDKKDWPINDFARQVAINIRNKQITDDVEIIVDFSGKANNLNEWQTKDALLDPDTGKPKFDFRGANLSRTNFAGANVEGYDFTGAKLDKASFESANLKHVIFDDTQANEVNFFNANLSGIKINKSSCRHAFMSKSKCTSVTIKNSDLSHTDIRAGKWDNATLEEVEADYAKLGKMFMSNANLVGVRLRRAAANGITIKKSKLEEVNASESSLAEGIIEDSNIKKCNLNDVNAFKVKMTEVKINELQAERINGEETQLVEVEITGSNFKDGNLKGGKLDRTSIEKTNMHRFNLENADAREIILGEGNIGTAITNDATLMGEKSKVASESESKLLFNNNGSIETPTQHKEGQVQANIAKNISSVRRTVGDTFQNLGKDLKSNAEFVDKPVNTYAGIGIGVVAGGIIATAIAVAVIASAGSILIPLAGVGVVAGIASGCIVAGVVAGGVAGGVLAKRGGASGMAAAAVGTLLGGPVGGIIAVAAYSRINNVVKRYTKYDIDKLISAPIYATGMVTEKIGKWINPTTSEGINIENNRSKQQQKYNEAQRKSKKSDLSADIIHEAKLEVLAKEDKKTENLLVNQNKHKGLQHEKTTLEKIKDQVKEFTHTGEDILKTSVEKIKRTTTGFAKGK